MTITYRISAIRAYILSVAFFALAALAVSPAEACPIPVFRYSVEFWEPDPYRLSIFYDGNVSSVKIETINEMLEGKTARYANLKVSLIDIGEQPRAMDRYLDDIAVLPELPWMVLRYPAISNKDEALWKGAADPATITRLLDSPARRAAAKELARGIPVWLMLESGDRTRDNRVYELLSRELTRLEQVLEIPDVEEWWDSRSGTEPPKLEFAIKRVSRNDAAEEFLISMLIGSEPDLADLQDHPMIFPLYGRGICLWSIVGKGITSATLTDAAEFLAGPCSCQVKMLNPGIDLLISKNWNEAVKIISDEMLAPVSSMSDFEDRGREAEQRLSAELERANEIRPGALHPDSTNAQRDDGRDPLDVFAERMHQVFPEEQVAEPAIETETVEVDDNIRGLVTGIFLAVIILIIVALFAVFRLTGRRLE